MKEACVPWLDVRWLTQGVLLKLPPVTHTVCSDASTQGWGRLSDSVGRPSLRSMPRTAQGESHYSFGRPSLRSMPERLKVVHIIPSGDQVSGQCPERLKVNHIILSGDQVSGQWPERLKVNHINWLEMRAIALVLRHFLPVIRNSHVMLHTVNTTVAAYIHRQGGDKVPILDGGGLGSPQLGSEKQRDAISFSHKRQPERYSRQAQKKGSSYAHRVVLSPVSDRSHQTDVGDPVYRPVCHGGKNFKFPVYVSPCPDFQAWAVDALSLSWDGMFAYAFPPSPLIPKVLQKIQTTQCRVILVAPLWPSRSWFSLLTSRLYDFPRKVPAKFDLLKQPKSTIFCKNVQSKNLHVWPFPGRLSHQNTFQISVGQNCRS